MEHVADSRLDRPPQPDGAHWTRVPRRDRNLGGAARKLAQSVAAARKRQSAADGKFLLDNLEPVVTPKIDLCYAFDEVSVFV